MWLKLLGPSFSPFEAYLVQIATLSYKLRLGTGLLSTSQGANGVRREFKDSGAAHPSATDNPEQWGGQSEEYSVQKEVGYKAAQSFGSQPTDRRPRGFIVALKYLGDNIKSQVKLQIYTVVVK